jgi:hypothetical protein
LRKKPAAIILPGRPSRLGWLTVAARAEWEWDRVVQSRSVVARGLLPSGGQRALNQRDHRQARTDLDN